MGNRKTTLLYFLDHEIPAGWHPEQSYPRTSLKKQIEYANLSMTAIYSCSSAITEKKGFKSEFCGLSSSGLFEKFKLWIEVNSLKSNFSDDDQFCQCKKTRDLSSGSKRYKDGEFYRISLKRFAERTNFYMIEYLPDDFVTTTGYLISSDGQVLKKTTRDTDISHKRCK
jgi:hypothetical protein